MMLGRPSFQARSARWEATRAFGSLSPKTQRRFEERLPGVPLAKEASEPRDELRRNLVRMALSFARGYSYPVGSFTFHPRINRRTGVVHVSGIAHVRLHLGEDVLAWLGRIGRRRNRVLDNHDHLA